MGETDYNDLLNRVRSDGYALKYVDKQNLYICLDAVRQNGMALQYVKDQTEEVCVAAVIQNSLALQFVREQTPKICLAAVEQNGMALQYVKNQTEKLCAAAISQNSLALQFVREQTPEICAAAMEQNIMAFEFVKNKTEKLCREVVRREWRTLEFVEERWKNLTLLEMAMKQDLRALKFVVENKQTSEMSLTTEHESQTGQPSDFQVQPSKRKREWVKYLDQSKLSLHPLQFANCERIMNNNAVYLFDEVGCGKTLSCGLMALECLENNPVGEVLIITTKTLVNTSNAFDYGQFLSDWYDKLPFRELGYDTRIKITSNHYSNIEKFKGSEFLLVIVDEAHLFLNNESRRYNALVNGIRAKKVVIATATPVRYNNITLSDVIKASDDYVDVVLRRTERDLRIYHHIAECLLWGGADKIRDRKILPDDWVNSLLSIEKVDPYSERDDVVHNLEERIICNDFNPKFPVSRYFKDILRCLESGNDPLKNVEKKQAVRCVPHIWEYEIAKNSDKNSEKKVDKNQVLLENITNILEKEDNSRFVVFTRLVDEEALELQNYFIDKGFSNLLASDITNIEEGCAKDGKSIAVVTGKNSRDLRRFREKTNLPTVLILTYQIAEQGVNLPGFNYVVNYHVPASVASLEQRFGRVDRMGEKGSEFGKIHFCFMICNLGKELETILAYTEYGISKAGLDTNTYNYYYALSFFMHSFLSMLPARNAVLSENMITQYTAELQNYRDMISRVDEAFRLSEQICKDDDSYKKMLADIASEIDESFDSDEDITGVKKFIENKLSQLTQQFENLEKVENIIKESVSKISDNIFYSKKSSLRLDGTQGIYLHTISAESCANTIAQSRSYKEYSVKLFEELRATNIFQRRRSELELLCENEFKDNISVLFTRAGRKGILEAFCAREKISCEDKELMLCNVDAVFFRLPLFKMFFRFKDILLVLVRSNAGYALYGRDKKELEGKTYSPFDVAKSELFQEIIEDLTSAEQSSDCAGTCNKNSEVMHLSSDFINTYGKYNENDFMISEANGVITASAWYKLVYWCLKMGESHFSVLTEVLQFVNRCYCYSNGKMTTEDIIKQVRHFYGERLSGVFTIDPSESRFHRVLYSSSGVVREFVQRLKERLLCNKLSNGQVLGNDIWTQGIYYDIHGMNSAPKRTWGEVLELPEGFRDIPFNGGDYALH